MRFFKDLKKYKSYALYAAKSTLRSEVTNSYLDWLWWVLEPFCMMCVYTIVFGYVFKSKEPNFSVFVYIGVSMWGFFHKTINGSVKLIKANKPTISRLYIPKQILLIIMMLVNAFKMMLSFGIIVIMMIYFKISVSWYLLWFVPIMLVFFVFTYGVGCFIMHYGVYVEDLSYICNIVLKVMMYFTGIFYSIESRVEGTLKIILCDCNPLALLINSARKSLIYAEGGYGLKLLIWAVISLLISIAGTRLVYKNENSYVKVI